MQFEDKRSKRPQESDHYDSRWWVVNILKEEVEKIKKLGAERNRFGNSKGWKTKAPNEGSLYHEVGLAGEYAASLVLNQRIASITGEIEHLRSGDLLGGIEVKTSLGDEPSKWDLSARASAIKGMEERVFVHCIGCWWPEYMVVTGWAYGKEILASTKTRFAPHLPDEKVFFLEQSKLKDINSLFDRFAELRKRKA